MLFVMQFSPSSFSVLNKLPYHHMPLERLIVKIWWIFSLVHTHTNARIIQNKKFQLQDVRAREKNLSG